MVIDYKDISFSFKAKRKRVRIRRLKIVLILFFIISLIFVVKSIHEYKRIKNLQALLLQNRPGQAAALLKKIESSFFYPDSKKELKALAYLFNKEISHGERILEKLQGRSTSVTSKDFLDYFLDNARYRELEVYTDYLLKKGEDARFYKILVETAFFNSEQSRELIKHLPAAEKIEKVKMLNIVNEIHKELESGKIKTLFDVNDSPLAYYDIDEKKIIPMIPGFDFSPFEADIENSLKFYKLTIAKPIQEKIHRLFRDYSGSFILLNLDDSSIIAAYSKPLNRKPENAVFFREYEPASIIKVLTLFTHLKHNGAELFPLQCRGKLPVDNKIFYDWLTHGKVSSYNEALAVSCNIAFARMGLNVGFKNLSEVLGNFYFNSGGIKDLFMNFKTGRYNRNFPSDYRLAKLSVGLSNNNEKRNSKEALVTTTTFHSALISGFIAHNGSIYSPYLIHSIKNMLNLGFYTHRGEIIHSFKDHNRVFFKVKEAMKEVVESPRGTGRRARVNFVKTAVKTGTAGNRRKGYDAILTGFFPADRPRYAFAFILQQAGKAELKGTLFLRDFLISFYEK